MKYYKCQCWWCCDQCP